MGARFGWALLGPLVPTLYLDRIDAILNFATTEIATMLRGNMASGPKEDAKTATKHAQAQKDRFGAMKSCTVR